MLKGLKRLAAGGILLRELRGTRVALDRLAVAQEQQVRVLADLLQALLPAAPLPSTPDQPGVEVTYVHEAQQQELMEIELGLTRATGHPPTEEEILAEYDRRLGLPAEPRTGWA